MASNQTIATILKTLKAAYPRFEVSEDTVRVWASFIADMDDDLLMAAVARFISASDHAFAPSIPEIRREATEIRREIAGIPSAFEAWEEVLLAPSPSPYRKMRDGQWIDREDYQWSHEVVGRVARQLGWGRSFPGNNPEADRAHFVKAYDAEVGRMMRAETQIPLVTEYIETERSKHLLNVTGEIRKLAREKGVTKIHASTI